MKLSPEKIQSELKGIIHYVDKGDKSNLSERLDILNSYLGRLTTLSAIIDDIYYKKWAELLDENQKTAEWKMRIKIENMIEGRLYRLKKQLIETIMYQCKNLTSLLIEVQSNRKHS